MKILLVDDSVDMGPLVTRSLSPYQVEQAQTLAEANAMVARVQYNLIIIDLNLPDGDGFSFCEQLAKSGLFDHIPKIILTAETQTSQKVFGLHCGADDYITKPFESAELKARVDSRLRGQKNMLTRTLHTHGLEFDSDFQRCFIVEGQQKTDLGFTPTEYRIFLSLATSEGKSLSRKEIVRAIWNSCGLNIEERGIDTHIAHLRKKMEPFGNWVISVYGKGYAFALPKKSQKAG